MKVYLTLAAFAHTEKFGGWVLTNQRELPNLVVDDYSSDFLTDIRKLTLHNIQVGKDWPLYYRQSFTYEDSSLEGEKQLYIVYTTYFPDIPNPQKNACWIKLETLNEIGEVWQKIVRITAVQRGT